MNIISALAQVLGPRILSSKPAKTTSARAGITESTQNAVFTSSVADPVKSPSSSANTRRTNILLQNSANNSSRKTGSGLFPSPAQLIISERNSKKTFQSKGGNFPDVKKEPDATEASAPRTTQRSEKIAAKPAKGNEATIADRKAFRAVYTTEYGSQVINSAFRKIHRPSSVASQSELSSREVITELQKRHGDNIFHGAAKSQKDEIISICGRPLLRILEMAEGLTYKPGESKRTTYRGVTMSREDLAKIIAAQRNGRPVAPESLFSTDGEKTRAKAFSKMGDGIPVIYTVKGHSSTAMQGPFSPIEEREYTYSPLSRMKVTDIHKVLSARNSESYISITLTEMAHPASAPRTRPVRIF
jgi:hypothetical protein